MTYSVYQHWDPLKVCVVGKSYPPEFYSWIENSRVKSLFEKIAIETEEDYQTIISKLNEFDVEVLRPDLPTISKLDGKYVAPPMNPRDHFVMIGDTFYHHGMSVEWDSFYNDVKDPSWPDAKFDELPSHIQHECTDKHGWSVSGNYTTSGECYRRIFDHLKDRKVKTKDSKKSWINGAMVSRIGKDLYFGTEHSDEIIEENKNFIKQEFPTFRTHIVDTKGHSDATYCPVCPGLIISLNDIKTYEHTFPGWEVIYLPNQSWDAVRPFLDLKEKNKGRWWIPGFEYDKNVIDTVEQWLYHWTGYVEETVFDVNMLIIDPKNVLVFNHNDTVINALSRYGITAHVVPFRHRYFWDGGIHCVTLDLCREGSIQDFFPMRG